MVKTVTFFYNINIRGSVKNLWKINIEPKIFCTFLHKSAKKEGWNPVLKNRKFLNPEINKKSPKKGAMRVSGLTVIFKQF